MRSILISILCFGCAEEAMATPDGAAPDPGCVPSGVRDLPDPDFADTDCDGIDGDASASVFIAPFGDDAADGTPAQPLRTYAHAVQVAHQRRKPFILAAVGEYDEPIAVAVGISLYGGYDPARAWHRARDRRTVFRSAGPVLRATDVTERTVIAFADFRAADAADGASSLAARIVRSPGVVLEDDGIFAGAGGRGKDGASGLSGEAGMAGLPGEDSGESCRQSATRGGLGAICLACGCWASGANGGMGGVASGEAGSDGSRIYDQQTHCGSAPGGAGGIQSGSAGTDGEPGRPGARGDSASPGILTAEGYVPANGGAGTPGVRGQGGGGGGGGGGFTLQCTYAGGAGGGGGSGGGGGGIGKGGGGGGASIALWIVGAAPAMVRVQLTAAAGGRGGLGGVGGAGGIGGAGGRAGQGPNGGGVGGRGGDGGAGGPGGAGADGPSIRMVVDAVIVPRAA